MGGQGSPALSTPVYPELSEFVQVICKRMYTQLSAIETPFSILASSRKLQLWVVLHECLADLLHVLGKLLLNHQPLLDHDPGQCLGLDHGRLDDVLPARHFIVWVQWFLPWNPCG